MSLVTDVVAVDDDTHNVIARTVVIHTGNKLDPEADRVAGRAAEHRSPLGLSLVGIEGVVHDENVDAVWLILEANVGLPRTVAIISATRYLG